MSDSNLPICAWGSQLRCFAIFQDPRLFRLPSVSCYWLAPSALLLSCCGFVCPCPWSLGLFPTFSALSRFSSLVASVFLHLRAIRAILNLPPPPLSPAPQYPPFQYLAPGCTIHSFPLSRQHHHRSNIANTNNTNPTHIKTF